MRALGAPDPTGVYRLDPILYGLNAEAITALQLSRAGVRLAAVLNRALALHPPLMPRGASLGGDRQKRPHRRRPFSHPRAVTAE